MIYIPTEVYPLGGLCRGKEAALERLELIAVQVDCLHFDTSDLMIRKERAGLDPAATVIERRAFRSRPRW